MGLTSLARHPSACCAQMQALSLQSRCEQLESKLAQLEAELTEAKQRAAASEDRLAKSGRWEQAYLAGLPQAPSVGGARLAAALQLFRHARPPAGPPVQPAYLFCFLCRAGGTSLQEVVHGLRQELQEKDLQLMQARHCPPVSPCCTCSQLNACCCQSPLPPAGAGGKIMSCHGHDFQPEQPGSRCYPAVRAVCLQPAACSASTRPCCDPPCVVLLQMHDDLVRERGKAQELQKQVLDQASSVWG